MPFKVQFQSALSIRRFPAQLEAPKPAVERRSFFSCIATSAARIEFRGD
jgi:hypothetical protein